MGNLVIEMTSYTYACSSSVKEAAYKELQAPARILISVPVLTNPDMLEVGVRLSGRCGEYPKQVVEVVAPKQAVEVVGD